MNTHILPVIPRHSEVDLNGKVKLRAVFDYIQEAAAQHAEILGCGMRFLAKEKGAAPSRWATGRSKR